MKYQYTGGGSHTLEIGGKETALYNGAILDLPEDNVKVMRLVSRKLLKELKEEKPAVKKSEKNKETQPTETNETR